jgi:hypothetical protein
MLRPDMTSADIPLGRAIAVRDGFIIYEGPCWPLPTLPEGAKVVEGCKR